MLVESVDIKHGTEVVENQVFRATVPELSRPRGASLSVEHIETCNASLQRNRDNPIRCDDLLRLKPFIQQIRRHLGFDQDDRAVYRCDRIVPEKGIYVDE